jgi:ribonuclease HII
MDRYIIGIDEVGRGSLAGPVVVVAACIPNNLEFRIKNSGKLQDSKKLTPIRREKWSEYFLKHPKILFSIARVYPKTIDRINISNAANLAAERAFKRVTIRHSLRLNRCKVFLDGGLHLGKRRSPSTHFVRSGRMIVKTIIRGDEKITAIKIASIIAKIHRDRLMVRLAKKYQKYGFNLHKGYGTRAHLKAIKKHGVSEIHRLSFYTDRN